MRIQVPHFAVVLCLGGVLFAQQQQTPPAEKAPWQTNQAPPRSDGPSARSKEANESSSRDGRIDISPPKDDDKNHPDSASAIEKAQEHADDSDVQEFRPWNPQKAMKNVEVGDFYFKRKNYRAAVDRYEEALLYKPNDAIANLRLGTCYEKLEDPDKAREHYEAYLKILPNGPESQEARKGLERLKGMQAKSPAGEPGPDKP
ncbi:MAG: tetratricopeptide repeat protein [Acidobacteria bacterium]|nr:tetratricopeptide repeat protein [Acidobacteriota bacterium]